MAKEMSKRTKQGIIKWIIGAILLIGLAIYWFVIKPDSVTYDVPSGTAEIHCIDVGQGDSTLIKVGDKIVQGVFLPFGVTMDDDATEIRNGGFGSTGR